MFNRRPSFSRRRQFASAKKGGPPRWPTTIKEERQGHTRLKLGLFFMLVGLWFYIVFFSSWFEVSALEIPNNDPVIKQSIYDELTARQGRKVKKIFPNKNIFMFRVSDMGEVEKKLGLAEIRFTKNYFDNAVYISYKNREPVVVLAAAGQTYYLDVYGKVITPVDGDNINPALPVIFTFEPLDNEDGLSGQAVKSVLRISEELEALSLKAVSFNIQNSPEIPVKPLPEEPKEDPKEKTAKEPPPALKPIKELAVVTNYGWSIYFGTQPLNGNETDLEQQLYNLGIFVKEKFQKINPRQLKYIDLRFGEKVYYK